MAKSTLNKTKSRARTISVPDVETATLPATPTNTVVSANNAPTHDEIARRAYEIYVARGQGVGRDLDDWIQAEKELLAKAHRNN